MSVRAMEAAGARVVVIRPAPFDFEGPGFVPEFNWGLREGVNAYLAATDAPMRTLADVIAFNDENPGRYAPWGQDRLRDCLWSPLGEQEARQISRANRQQARDYLTRSPRRGRARRPGRNRHAAIADLPVRRVPRDRGSGRALPWRRAILGDLHRARPAPTPS